MMDSSLPIRGPDKITTREEVLWLINRLQGRLATSQGHVFQTEVSLQHSTELGLGAVRSQLFHIERERDLLRRVLHSVEREEAALNYAQKRAINASSPVNRLPDEILSLIFDSNPLPIPRSYCDSVEPKLDRNYFRDAAAAVCYRWRRVILHTPSCWSHIQYSTGDRGSTPLAAIRAFQSRSGGVLLSITIRVLGSPTLAQFKDKMVSAVNALQPCLYRCRSLGIYATSLPRKIEEFVRIESPMPALEDLEIEWDVGLLVNITRQLHVSVGPYCAPRRLNLIPSESSMVMDGFNWSRLSHLKIHGYLDVEDTLSLLSQTPSLEHLDWSYSELSEDPDIITIELQLPILKSLQLTLNCTIVETLNAPLLEFVDICCLGVKNILPQPHIQVPSIRCLRLSSSGIDDVASILRGLLHLEELSIFITKASEFSVLMALTHLSSPTTWVCPMLRLLDLSFPSVASPEFDANLATLVIALASTRGAKVEPDRPADEFFLERDPWKEMAMSEVMPLEEGGFVVRLSRGLRSHACFEKTLEAQSMYALD